MNLQQVFNESWTGLRAQGFVKSVAPAQQENRWMPWGAFNCASEDGGKHCAIQHASNALGRVDIFQQAEDSPVLQELMLCHNDATSPADMERRLREFAAARGLSIPGESTDDYFTRFMAKVREPVLTDADARAAAVHGALHPHR